ncbi:MAG: metabolite traffic protein EboE [Bacteroidota bacterium]
MRIINNGHLCYCTNIHLGESWPEVLESLEYALRVKAKISPDAPFGIGLRLSAQAAEQLGEGGALRRFKEWLTSHDCYVFTMNGFPYGGFHGQVVKDQVHAPDWTTPERLDYTRQLFNQLAYLLPEGMDGGVSTSPISYRLWHKTPAELEAVLHTGARQMAKLVAHLAQLKKKTGKQLHLDVEPEPDGVLENSREFLTFFDDYLLTTGVETLQDVLACDAATAADALRQHLQLCYDVCHFAVAYEEHAEVLRSLTDRGIKVGKIQISAAVKTLLGNPAARGIIRERLQPYHESTYLHQTAYRNRDGTVEQFPDLDVALGELNNPSYEELRTHFHVPIFTEEYGALQSTRSDIETVLRLWQEQPFSPHLEVETYTWDVLPDNNQLELTESIYRELIWVVETLHKTD